MDTIFGIQTTNIMFVFVAIFALCMLGSAVVYLRNRVVWRLGIRNVPRRPAQTILIVIGLMLSTLIISAAFTTGDTLDHSIKSEVTDLLGPVDEVVVVSSSSQTDTVGSLVGSQIPEQVATDLRAQLAGDPNIDGVLPALTESVPVINPRTLLSEPSVILTGIVPDLIGPFGGLRTPDGGEIDLTTLPPDGIVLGKKAAGELDAVVGDTLIVYARNQPSQVTVAAIAEDSPLTGYFDPETIGGFAIPLDWAQAVLNLPDTISLIAVSNRGDATDGVALTDPVVASVNAALAGTPYRAYPLKQRNLEAAEQAGNVFMSMFLVFGLFSIAVGILLIFLIFVMLAAERKPEMGMARAVGMKRRQLTEMFLAEGIAYDLLSALVGAALGVGVAFIMAGMMARTLGAAIVISPSASWTSLVISYTLGVTVTFLTILVSSWRVSKLNVVQAIRGLPEPVRQRAGRRWLVGGLLALVAGPLMAVLGGSSGNLFLFETGVSLAIVGVGATARRLGAPARWTYSLASLALLAWWLVLGDLFGELLPHMSGGIEMFFLSGIVLVGSATILIMWNAEAITALVGLLGRGFSRWLPAVKTAVAYPLSNKVRTGMTIAMFSLVIFSLVMMAAINTNIVSLLSGEDAGGGWDIHAGQAPTNPIPDFQQALAQNGVDVGAIEATASFAMMPIFNTQVRMAGATDWGTYTVSGMDADFIDQSAIPLQTRATGYDSDAAVWAAIRDNPDLAIIDSFAMPTSGLNIGAAAFTLQGVSQGDTTMAPAAVDIADPASGRMRTVKVIGIIKSEVFALQGLFVQRATFDAVFATPNSIDYVVRVTPGTDADAMAKDIEAALITYGVQAKSIHAIIDEQMSTSRGFLRLFEGFMGLGLVVGIAALGVIAFRSVVERRQQIGMLRAIGFQRAMVAASFLIESSLVTVLGVLSGTALGLVLARNLTTSDYFIANSGHTFIVPWLDVVVFFLIALVASLLMAYVPSRRASRVPIAEALRYE